MKIWADVSDAAGTILNPSPIRLINITVTKDLDGSGHFKAETLARYKLANDWLQEESFITLYTYSDRGIRQVGAGIIKKRAVSQSGSSWRLNVSGPDILDELRRRICYVAWTYDNMTLPAVVNDLVNDLGWTAIVADAPGTIHARFDGTRRLQAVFKVAQSQGFHMRPGVSGKVIEVGPFGEDPGFTLMNVPRMHKDLYENDSLFLIDSIQAVSSTDEVINWMIPYGGGEGEAAITLKKSTRNAPYPILTMESKGKTLYYITDAGSAAAYGQHEVIATFKDVAPISNGSQAVIDAANFLYDNAAAQLIRLSKKNYAYTVNVRKLRADIRVGQRIRIMYKGFVYDDDGNPVNYLNINEMFWVLSVSENYGMTQGASLMISNVDQMKKDSLDYLVESIEEVNLRNVKPQIYPFYFEKTTYDFIQAAFVEAGDNFKKAEFEIRMKDNVTTVNRVTISFRTRPLFATANVTGSLTWTPLYGAIVTNSGFYPQGVKLEINDVDVSALFGGPWNVGISSELVVEDLDITSYIEALDIHATTTIKFKCTAANGDISYPGYAAFPATALKSSGTVELTINVIGSTQNIIAST